MNFFNICLAIVLAVLMFQFETSIAEQTSAQQKVIIKQNLKTLTPEARLDAISRAEVVEKKIDKLHRESPEKIAEIDMVQELSQICGPKFNFISDESEPNVAWPTVNCKYHRSEKVLGGSTNKFLCDFTEINKNGEQVVKTRKVKYLAFRGIKYSELVPSLLSSTIARMLGFPTESYCPALIQCENCPHNMPYEFGKGRSRPSEEVFEFRDAMVEMPTDLMTIAPNIPQRSPRHPHGLEWSELLHIQGTESKSAREKAIEREAWMLWLNFIVEVDAHYSNQRVACDKASLNGAEVYCEKPVLFTHDYGQSFYERFQFKKWKNHIPLIQNSEDTCRGGLTSAVFEGEGGNPRTPSGYISPIVSSEARDFLVSRLRNISDKQWRDIVRIVNTQRLFKVTPDQFLNAIKTKIAIMAQAHCAPFDLGSSILSAIQK